MATRRSPQPMVPGSPAVEIVPEIGVADGDLVVPRLHGVSPMNGTELDPILRNLDVRTIVAVGVSVNVALTNLVFDAVNASYQVVVPRDAVAGIPADYVDACGKPSPYQKHAPLSLMFEINADGHVAGAPRDAFFKSGGGGFGIGVVPSLDLVLYKMAGDDSQYDPRRTGIPQDYPYDGSRDRWKPAARSQFSDGPIGTDDGLRRVLEMVCASVVK